MQTPHELNANQLKLFKDSVPNYSDKSPMIISLVGNPSTGKTSALNKTIEFLQNDPKNWSLELQVNSGKFKNLDAPGLAGLKTDQIAIFKNSVNNKRVGIFTSGDNTDIVRAGLNFLMDQNCDIIILASHEKTFSQFLCNLFPLALQIGTHKIESDILKDIMIEKNARAIINIVG